jgi:probable FeS assembly SUF system protein SufT
MVHQSFSLRRALQATAIPQGTVTPLHEGTEVLVTQALGGSVTVRAGHGLFRIAPQDLDALGLTDAELAQLRQESAAPAEFSEAAVWDALRQCFDPEIPVNIVDLGLIYDLSIEPAPAGGHLVEVKMTLTAQGCGMGPVIADDARQRILTLPGVADAKVHIVWDPVWNPRMISEAGRKILGL